jgi:hypothetical protein
MNKQWERIWTEEASSNLHVNLPSELEETILFDHPAFGQSVQWHYDKNAEVIIVSNAELEKDRYEHIKRSERLGTGQIRPPKDILEKLVRPVYPGLQMAYLAHEEMLGGDSSGGSGPNSVYLLTDSQVRQFMNEVPGEQNGDSLREKLQETPAFLPPVR